MPWIFMCLMAINAVYFGWKFMEVSRPQAVVKERSLPQMGARVELLSESRLVQAPAPAGVAEGGGAEAGPASGEGSAPPGEVQTAVQRQCFFVGPYAREGEARSFSSAMKAKQFHVRVEKRKVEVKDYWVFMPPFINRSRAEEKLRELKAQGVQGFIVKDGVFVNAVSLNHFSRPELAQDFLGKMKEKGITVEYRELSTPGAEFWTYVSPSQSQAEIKVVIDDYLASRDALRREITACDD